MDFTITFSESDFQFGKYILMYVIFVIKEKLYKRIILKRIG